MQKSTIDVHAKWDEEAGVWVATTSDIDGFAVEAGTLEQLSEKAAAAIADLIEMNGFERAEEGVWFQMKVDRLFTVPRACAA